MRSDLRAVRPQELVKSLVFPPTIIVSDGEGSEPMKIIFVGHFSELSTPISIVSTT